MKHQKFNRRKNGKPLIPIMKPKNPQNSKALPLVYGDDFQRVIAKREEILDQEEQLQMEKLELEIQSAIGLGKMSVRDLIVGIDSDKVLAEFQQTGSVSGLAKHFAIPAISALGECMQSFDERVKMAAAKTVLDLAKDGDKDQELKQAEGYTRMERVIINGEPQNLRVGDDD